MLLRAKTLLFGGSMLKIGGDLEGISNVYIKFGRQDLENGYVA